MSLLILNRFDLDYDRTNNYSKTSGVLKKVEPLQFKMYTRLEDGNRNQIFWMPTSGWNAHSGYMLGLGISQHVSSNEEFRVEYKPNDWL